MLVREHIDFKRGQDTKSSLGVGMEEIIKGLSPHAKYFINHLTAEYFGDKEVNNEHIPINRPGWYWADASDHYRYSDFFGPYDSKEEALEEGRAYRLDYVQRNW